jgi:hypothetical protein
MHSREAIGARSIGGRPEALADGTQRLIHRPGFGLPGEPLVWPQDDAGQNRPPRPTEKSVF